MRKSIDIQAKCPHFVILFVVLISDGGDKMSVMSPKLSEVLVKTTRAKDIDDALNKIFSEYLELKLKKLQQTIEEFEKKWDMSFEKFKKRTKENTLKSDIYSFDTEKDYWQWEEVVTLRKHYEKIQGQWI